MYQGVGASGGGMWQGVEGCGRVWGMLQGVGHVAGVDVCCRASGLWQGWGRVAGVGGYVGVCGRV